MDLITKRQNPEISGKDAGVYAILFILSVVPYIQSITHGYFLSDDFALLAIARNLHIQDLFTVNFYHRYGTFGFIRPVGLLTWKLNYALYGLYPAGYHLTNVAINAVCTLLVFKLARELSEDTVIAFIAGIAFIVSPSHSDTVNWVATRYDLLACMFYLASMICYIRFKKTAVTGYYAGALASGFLALFSKEMAITLPLAILVYEIFSGEARPLKRLLLRVLPFFTLTLLFLVTRIAVFHSVGGYKGPNGSAHTQVPSLSDVGFRLVMYFKTLFYGFENILDFNYLWLGASISLVLLTGLFISLSEILNKRRQTVLVIIFMATTLIPLINFTPITSDYMRFAWYLYFPSIFSSIAVGYLFTPAKAAKKSVKISLFACAAVFVLSQYMAQEILNDKYIYLSALSEKTLDQFNENVRPQTLNGLDIEIYSDPDAPLCYGAGSYTAANFVRALHYYYNFPGQNHFQVTFKEAKPGKPIIFDRFPAKGYNRKIIFLKDEGLIKKYDSMEKGV